MDFSKSQSALAQMFTADDIRMLADIGLMALAYGRKKTARQIFNGLSVLRPGSEVAIVAEAMYRLAIGEAQGAVDILQAAEPSDRILPLLAVAMLGARKSAEAQKILRATVKDQPEAEFSGRMLHELQGNPAAV